MATQVNENKLLRENSIKIVGRLTDAHVTLGNRKDNGQGYISVDATVVSLINGVSNEFKTFSASGSPNLELNSINLIPFFVLKNLQG